MTPQWHSGAGKGVCGSALDLPGCLLSETPFYAVSQLVPDAQIHPCCVTPGLPPPPRLLLSACHLHQDCRQEKRPKPPLLFDAPTYLRYHFSSLNLVLYLSKLARVGRLWSIHHFALTPLFPLLQNVFCILIAVRV